MIGRAMTCRLPSPGALALALVLVGGARDASAWSEFRFEDIPPALACPAESESRGFNPSTPCISVERSLVLTGPITFDKRHPDELEAKSLPHLEQLAVFLARNPDVTRLLIGVHLRKDEEPPRGNELSRRRARAVAEALFELGVSRDRIEHRGFATNVPLVPGNGRWAARNERVEFEVLTWKGKEPPGLRAKRCATCPVTGKCEDTADGSERCRAPTDAECRAAPAACSRMPK